MGLGVAIPVQNDYMDHGPEPHADYSAGISDAQARVPEAQPAGGLYTGMSGSLLVSGRAPETT